MLNEINADIIVIQECEDPDLTNDLKYKVFSRNHIWLGSNKNKGLGIFAKESLYIEKLHWSNIFNNHEVKYFLPIQINNFLKLVAVWAHGADSPTFGYIGQLWKYLQINKDQIRDTIFIGDFNSNRIWDSWDRWWNHTDVVEILRLENIESLYHSSFKELHGEESLKTFFMNRIEQKSYHIDYCFLPNKFIENGAKIQVGKYSEWKHVSDHVPIIIDLPILMSFKQKMNLIWKYKKIFAKFATIG